LIILDTSGFVLFFLVLADDPDVVSLSGHRCVDALRHILAFPAPIAVQTVVLRPVHADADWTLTPSHPRNNPRQPAKNVSGEETSVIFATVNNPTPQNTGVIPA